MSATLFNPLLNGLVKTLDLRQQQHALTATNLANSDTPGFKAKIIDFRHALSDAIGKQEGLPMLKTHQMHMGGLDMENPPIRTLEAPPWSVDGNSVVPEREMARLQENSLMYRATAGGLSRRLAMLKYAAGDGK